MLQSEAGWGEIGCVWETRGPWLVLWTSLMSLWNYRKVEGVYVLNSEPSGWWEF